MSRNVNERYQTAEKSNSFEDEISDYTKKLNLLSPQAPRFSTSKQLVRRQTSASYFLTLLQNEEHSHRASCITTKRDIVHLAEKQVKTFFI